MKFSEPALVEQVVWDMKLADVPRGQNRALIDSLFNGDPPWTVAEAEAAKIRTNVNWLEAPKLAADARRTYNNAFLKSGKFFTVSLDSGPVHKRGIWGQIITNEINRILKRSMPYFELLRSQFAMTVLHGIGPALWPDSQDWCPEPVALEDVLIPSGTYLTMQNLDYFGIFRQFTPAELSTKIDGPHVDKGWNIPLAKRALKWAHDQGQSTNSYPTSLSPEKMVDQFKENLGFYGTDCVPTVDCWDFYYKSDEGKKCGWRRCMVLDTPASQEVMTSPGRRKSMGSKNSIGEGHGEWLFDGRDRIWSDDLSKIIHFQFGDCSAKAPFKYHTVRSLGWLLYAVCHVTNRLRCKVNDATFEALLQYFRVSNPDDHERITKIELQNYGVIPDGIDFVKEGDRWKVDHQLVQTSLQQNRSMMMETAAQFREGRDQQQAGVEKTATQIMAEVNSANALVGSMMLQAYQYHIPQYEQITDRFCNPESKDPEVRKFRRRVLSKGVPEEMLDSDRWITDPERVLGHGNKTLEIAMADKLMAVRHLHDPSAQTEILQIYDAANSDNPELAMRLTQTAKPPSDSVHEAQLIFGTLMEGVPVSPHRGQNSQEMAATLIKMTAFFLKQNVSLGIDPNKRDLLGLKTVLAAIQMYFQLFSQDKASKSVLQKMGKEIGALTQAVGIYEKQVMEADKARMQQGPQQDPKDAAKAQAMVIQAKTKAQLQAQAHAQKTQQRQVQFQQKLAQDQQKHQLDMQTQLQQTQVDTAAKDLETAAEIERQDAKAENEPSKEE